MGTIDDQRRADLEAERPGIMAELEEFAAGIGCSVDQLLADPEILRRRANELHAEGEVYLQEGLAMKALLAAARRAKAGNEDPVVTDELVSIAGKIETRVDELEEQAEANRQHAEELREYMRRRREAAAKGA